MVAFMLMRFLRHCEVGDVFIALVTILQLTACALYLYRRRWAEAALWMCYALANTIVLYLLIKNRP